VKTPQVSIIILNWNNPDYTINCLHSLGKLTYPNYDVILLDNGSEDDSVQKLQAILLGLNYPVEFITNSRNLGFAEGNNVGIRHALERNADYVLLLNNDTEVASDFIEPLVQMAQSDYRIGITGPKIYYFDSPTRIWSAGGLITESGWTQQLGVNAVDSPEYDYLKRVDYVSGCAMLVKREVIEKIGMLDPRFFAYYEETDWCARAAKAGYSIWYVPQSIIWHKISLEAREQSPLYIYLMTRNRLLFLRNRGASNLRVLLNMVLVDLRTIVAWTIWKRYQSVRPLRQWRLIGMWHFLQGKFGEPDL